MRLVFFILVFLPSVCFSQISIDSLYNINPKSQELQLNLRKYEKQDNLGRICMGVGIVGVMIGHITVNSIKNVSELKHDRLNQINFLTFTPISLFGVYNLVRAPHHIKKHLYLY
jgi:hypothetical protein